MRTIRTRLTFLVTLAAALALACAGGEQHAAQETPATTNEPGARTLEIPGASSSPPAPSGQAASGPLVWESPEGWVAVEPASRMRFAQYRVAGEAGDGECIVFYFGPGQGGDPMANASRWAGQFKQPDGASSLGRMQTSQVDGAAVPVMLVEVTGTYDGGMTMTAAPAEARPDYMLLGGIAQGPDAPWFFKFTGPEATLRAERERFVQMLRTLRPG